MTISILSIIGLALILFGVAALFIPNLARLINFPGNARIKAIGVMVIGAIITIAGFFYEVG